MPPRSSLAPALDAFARSDYARARLLAEAHLTMHPDDEEAVELLDDVTIAEEAALAPPSSAPAAGANFLSWSGRTVGSPTVDPAAAESRRIERAATAPPAAEPAAVPAGLGLTRGIALLAGLHFFAAFVLGVPGVVALLSMGRRGALAGAVILAVAALSLALAVGLWRLRPAAWAAALLAHAAVAGGAAYWLALTADFAPLAALAAEALVLVALARARRPFLARLA